MKSTALRRKAKTTLKKGECNLPVQVNKDLNWEYFRVHWTKGIHITEEW